MCGYAMGRGEVGSAMRTLLDAYASFCRQLWVVVDLVRRVCITPAHRGTPPSARQTARAQVAVGGGRDGSISPSCVWLGADGILPCQRHRKQSRSTPMRPIHEAWHAPCIGPGPDRSRSSGRKWQGSEVRHGHGLCLKNGQKALSSWDHESTRFDRTISGPNMGSYDLN